jgi:hypothetical protein
MCLYIDKEKTKNHSDLLRNKKHIFYKDFTFINFSFIKKDFRLCAFFTHYEIKLDCKMIEPKEFYIEKNRFLFKEGVIHAYVTKAGSNFFNFFLSQRCHRFPIIVESDDIIAFGIDNDVCFSKYRLSKQSLRKIKTTITLLNF